MTVTERHALVLAWQLVAAMHAEWPDAATIPPRLVGPLVDCARACMAVDLGRADAATVGRA